MKFHLEASSKPGQQLLLDHAQLPPAKSTYSEAASPSFGPRLSILSATRSSSNVHTLQFKHGVMQFPLHTADRTCERAAENKCSCFMNATAC